MRKSIWIIGILASLLIFSALRPWLEQQQIIAATVLRMTAQQLALENYATNLTYMNKNILDLLKVIPSAARIRVAFVRPPAVVDSLPTSLRFDVTHAISSPGHAPSELSLDHSVIEWSDFFNSFMNKRCVHLRTKEITNSATVLRLNTLHVVEFIGCPIWNDRAQMLGALFVSWEKGDIIPTDMAATINLVKITADQIGLHNQRGF